MRTTVNIDERLLAMAKRLARSRHKTLGEFVEEALQVHVLRPEPRAAPELPVFDRGGEFLAGIDPTSNQSLYAAIYDDSSA